MRGPLKKKILLGTFGLALLVGFYSIALAAAPPSYDGLLSAGIVRLNSQDFDGALLLFRNALKEKPDGVEAQYYIGVAQARAGRTDEAEKSLQAALSMDQTFLPAYFDLGVLYYQTRQDEKALKAFALVERIDPGRARVYYYEGLILHREGKAKEAAEKFEKASALDPSIAREASLDAAAAYYEAGDLGSARKAFQNVVTLAPGSQAAQVATDFLDRMPPEGAKKKRWDLTFSAGMQYDTNVILEPSGGAPVSQSITKERDLGAVLYLRGRDRWLDNSEWIGRAEYTFYQNLHTYDSLHHFNIQNHDALLSLGRRFGSKELDLEYEAQYTSLGGDAYLLQQSVGPRFLWPESDKNLTEFGYRYGDKSFYNSQPLFPTNSDRDVHTHQIGLTHYFAYLPHGSIHLGYLFEKEMAGSSLLQRDWSFDGHHILLGIVSPPWKRFTLAIDGDYMIRRFLHDNSFDPGRKRDDDGPTLVTTVSRSIGRSFDVALQYLYQRNHSDIALFDYSRSIYSALVSAKF